MANPQRNSVRLPRPGRPGRTESARRHPAPPRLEEGPASIAFPAAGGLLAAPSSQTKILADSSG